MLRKGPASPLCVYNAVLLHRCLGQPRDISRRLWNGPGRRRLLDHQEQVKYTRQEAMNFDLRTDAWIPVPNLKNPTLPPLWGICSAIPLGKATLCGARGPAPGA